MDDIRSKYYSRRFGRDIEIGIDDVVAIVEDDNIDFDDVNGVRRLVGRFVKICESDRLGSVEFCVDVRNRLVGLDVMLNNAIRDMRKCGLSGRTRRVSRGSRERGRVFDYVRGSVVDVNDEIKRRKFFEEGVI